MVEVARQISTAANVWADIGSRPELGGVAEVARQAESMGLRFQLVDTPADWRGTDGLLMPEPVWGSEGGGGVVLSACVVVAGTHMALWTNSRNLRSSWSGSSSPSKDFARTLFNKALNDVPLMVLPLWNDTLW